MDIKRYLFILYLISLNFISFIHSAEIRLNVNLLKTGQYNVSDFLDPSVSLWTVTSQCIDCPEEGLEYFLEVKLNFNDIKPAIWGYTKARNLMQNEIDQMTNFDFQGGSGLLNDYDQNEEFISQLEANYYLPAGNVELIVNAYAYDGCPFQIQWAEDFSVDCNLITSGDSESYYYTVNNVVSELLLFDPANNANVIDPYPWFRWESPGFTEGVQIDYKLFVYLFDPSFHSNFSDAISDDIFLYFSMIIPEQFETGVPRQISVQYPSNDRELACGYQYVWYVEANEIIQDSPFNGESGIWGWPEPISSPLYSFNYGATIKSDNLISPSIGSRVSTVRPTFHIETISCANSYEIWLSDSEDSEVENPIWTSGALSSNINIYPSDATGLAPNRNYKWKIRLNPDGEPSPWSEIFDFSISDYSLDAPISGEVLDNITPTFYFSVPMDIASYELRISNSDDPLVESANIFNESIPSSAFQLPQDIPEWLLPGNSYYWKLIFFDDNDNIIGDIDDYTKVESFRIKDIQLNSPSNGTDNLALTPSFMWDGITGIPQYEMSISTSDDPSMDDPFFVENISGTFFQYPEFSDYPLEPGSSYFWRIVPLDNNENMGVPSTIFSFSTSLPIIELSSPSNGANNLSLTPSFMWEGVTGISQYEISISPSDDPSIDDPFFVENISGTFFQYPQFSDYPLEAGGSYFWRIIPIYSNGNMGVSSAIFSFSTSLPIIELSSPSNGADNLSLSPSFMWEGATGVSQYQISISTSDDPSMDDPFFVENISGTFFQYPQFSDYPLEAGGSYFWRIIPLDSNDNMGVSSIIFSFSTSVPINNDFSGDDSDDDSDDEIILEDEEDISEEDSGDEVVTEDEEDILEEDSGDEVVTEDEEDISEEDSGDEVVTEDEEDISEQDSGDEVVTEDEGDISEQDSGDEVVTEDEGDISEEDSGDEIISGSDVVVSSSAETTGGYETEMPVSSKPEFSVSPSSGGSPKNIIIDLLAIVEGAEEYIISFSLDPSMGTPFEELNLVDYQTQIILDGSELEWDLMIYIQISAISGGNLIGELSSVQVINLPEKPGSNDQVGIAVSLESGSAQPIIEIINSVLNASSYTMVVSANIDMTTIHFSEDINIGMPRVYPESASPLLFGQTYYFQVFASDDDGEHGIPSSITSVFIPNIVPPIITDRFSWDATVPASNSYIIQFSTTDDFGSIDLEQIINGTTFTVPEGSFDYSTTYYWRVQGLDNESNLFGNPSSTNFFTTESVLAPVLNTLSDETSLLPEFSWEGVEQAHSYLISIGSDANLEEIIWSNVVTSTNTIYDESALLLNFSTTYYWNVVTLSDTGDILSVSTIGSFSTTSLFPVSDLAPNGATETFTPSLSWELNSNFAFYRVLIANDSEFNEIVVNLKAETNSLTIDEGLLESGMHYYWKVTGLDGNSESLVGPSEITLLVMPSIAEIPLISPSESEQIANLTPVLKWGALENVNSYKIIISTDAEMSALILDEIVSMAEFTIPEDKSLINGMTYYWQIQVVTDELSVNSSIGTFSTPPAITINISSLDEGAEVSILNPTFSWGNIEGISAYNIQFSTNSDFSESWLVLSGSNNFEYPSEPMLEFNQPYYWQVCALNNEGERISEWTKPRTFSLSNIYIVNLEAPTSGEVATTKNPTFSWAQIENVDQYEIRLSSNEDYSQIVWQSDNVSTNSVQYPSSGVEKLLGETVYYWSVRAISENNALGEFSESFNFTVSEDNTPTLTGPINETSETINPFFTWDKIPKANSYGLVLGSNNDLSQIIFEKNNLSDKQYQYPADGPPLGYDTSYYWKVIAYEEEGNPLGDYSNIATFKTPSGIIEIEFIYSGNDE